MTIKVHSHVAPTLISGLALVCACNGRLEVIGDDIGSAGNSPFLRPDSGSPDTSLGGSTSSPWLGIDAGSSCTDGILDGRETDIDCGGTECGPCPSGARCERHDHCTSGVCRAELCQPPACDDGVRNGEERGVDCGGSCSEACPVEPIPCVCASSPGLMALGCQASPPVEWAQAFASADGSVVAFSLSDDTATGAFRWTAASGSERIAGQMPSSMSDDGRAILIGATQLWRDGASTELPFAGEVLSADGSSVSGVVQEPAGFRPTRWTATSGLVPLGPIPSFSFAGASAGAMSADGSVVAGWRATTLTPIQLGEAYRATPTGFEALGPLPEGARGAEGLAVSRDGSIVAGSTYAEDSGYRVDLFRWSAADGVRVIAPAARASQADVYLTLDLFLNDAGSVLVSTNGATSDAASPRAFRWSEATGSVILSTTPERPTIATATDATGDVVVGYLADTASPFVWSAAGGLRELAPLLESSGVALEGWQFSKPLSLSHDGRVLVGNGSCGGVPAIYRVTLPQ